MLAEAAARAETIEEVIRQAGDDEWPPGTHALRLVDLDGQEIYEWLKTRSGRG